MLAEGGRLPAKVPASHGEASCAHQRAELRPPVPKYQPPLSSEALKATRQKDPPPSSHPGSSSWSRPTPLPWRRSRSFSHPESLHNRRTSSNTSRALKQRRLYTRTSPRKRETAGKDRDYSQSHSRAVSGVLDIDGL